MVRVVRVRFPHYGMRGGNSPRMPALSNDAAAILEWLLPDPVATTPRSTTGGRSGFDWRLTSDMCMQPRRSWTRDPRVGVGGPRSPRRGGPGRDEIRRAVDRLRPGGDGSPPIGALRRICACDCGDLGLATRDGRAQADQDRFAGGIAEGRTAGSDTAGGGGTVGAGGTVGGLDSWRTDCRSRDGAPGRDSGGC
jgi:hypothetical protein